MGDQLMSAIIGQIWQERREGSDNTFYYTTMKFSSARQAVAQVTMFRADGDSAISGITRYSGLDPDGAESTDDVSGFLPSFVVHPQMTAVTWFLYGQGGGQIGARCVCDIWG
jgi:hypothetical protein